MDEKRNETDLPTVLNENKNISVPTSPAEVGDDVESNTPKNNSKKSNLLKPIIILVIVCLLASSLLAVTNSITQPIIAQNTATEEDESRKKLLPTASSFTDLTPSPLPEGISSVFKADNDTGYVIGSYAQGYGGKVPVLVGIDSTGTVTGVKFLENSETPGLGQKVVTDTAFAEQFIGRKASIQVQDVATATAGATATATESIGSDETTTEETDIDDSATATTQEAETDGTATATTEETAEDDFEVQGIAAATISSDAAANAVEYALEYYAISIMGSTISYDISSDVLQALMPNSTSWLELNIQATDIAHAYLGNDGTYVIVAQGKSQNTLYAAVALNSDGTITGLWLDTSKESENYGLEIADNKEYIEQYIGKNSTDSIQGVAGVTNTSKGIKAAVDAALNAFPAAKEAA